MDDIHIGEIIKKKFEERQMSATDFAERIHHSRSTVYDIFKRKSIDIDLLLKISEVLQYDFMEEIYLKRSDPFSSKRCYLMAETDMEVLNQLEQSGKIHYIGKLVAKGKDILTLLDERKKR